MILDPSQGLIGWLGTGLLHATLLALLTWILTLTILRRCRPGLKAALWTVVLLKFLLPPVLPLPGEMAFSHWISQMSFRESLSRIPAPQDMGVPMPASSEPRSDVSQQARETESTPLWRALLAAYLLGAAALALRAGISAFRLRRWMARLPTAEGSLGRQVEELAGRLKLRRTPQLHLCEDDTSPFVTGLLRPRLVFPRRLIDLLEPSSREALIVHELAHIRRGDLWLRGLRNLARLLLFFWPPVWWVCRRVERSVEMACDHWALAVSGASPGTYARTLLLVAKRAGGSGPGLQQLAFATRRRPLEERFDMILKRKEWTLPRISWLTVVLMAAWAAFAWAGAAAGSQEQPQEKQEKTEAHYGTLKAAKERHMHAMQQERALIELKAQKMLAEKVSQADLDGDGDVSVEEYKEFLAQELEARKEEVYLNHPQADLNADGLISNRELKVFDMEQQVLEAKEGLRSDPEYPVDFHVMPTANRVAVAKFEPIHENQPLQDRQAAIEKLLREHPEIDADGDGKLSAEESKALRAKLEGLKQNNKRFPLVKRIKEKENN
ncbi:MAG TPA: M56 family metallopeptidase [Acidobacteriota bacterium]|nr:M56 family metallopeptidase [Acidobacteriota bacterium]